MYEDAETDSVMFYDVPYHKKIASTHKQRKFLLVGASVRHIRVSASGRNNGCCASGNSLPVSQFILPPGQVAPRGASQPWLACPPGGNLSRDILPPTLVTFTPGGQHIPAGLSCPPGVKLNQPGYLAPHP